MKERPITDKQKTAIYNMRRALGYVDPFKDMPQTISTASNEIGNLKAVIHNNLSLGGAINPRHAVCSDNRYDDMEGF